MKFGKMFENYLTQNESIPDNHVGVKHLKKILKGCRKCQNGKGSHTCHDVGSDCEMRFFQLLTSNTKAVLGDFNNCAKKLLHLHLNSKLKCLLSFGRRANENSMFLEECRVLLSYVAMNHMAVRKLVKKFEKVHGRIDGSDLKSHLLEVDQQLMRSPFLLELNALSRSMGRPLAIADAEIVLNKKQVVEEAQLAEEECEEEQTVMGGVRISTDSTCPVCLETLHDPLALTCGHVFCNVCACESAGIPLAFGIKSAPEDAKCPMCRQRNVFRDAVKLKIVDKVFRKRDPEAWRKRRAEVKKYIPKQRSDYWKRKLEARENFIRSQQLALQQVADMLTN